MKPIWKEFVELIRNHQDQNFNPSTFEKLFGVFIICIFRGEILCLHYVNFRGHMPPLLVLESFFLLCRRILNIILPKRKVNYQFILRNGDLD